MNRSDPKNVTFKKKNRHPKKSFLKSISGKLSAINVFYVVSAVSQIILGLVVTLVSILNLVTPMFLAATLSLIGCIVAMLGLYQLYDVLKGAGGSNDLVRDAIERAIKSRN